MHCSVRLMVFFVLGGAVLSAHAAVDRDVFLKQQAFAEMQRVTAQIDIIQNNQEDITHRLAKLEADDGAKAEVAALRAEVASLRALVADLKTTMHAQRGEIVKDLSQRIAKVQQAAPAPAPVTQIPHKEYIVQSGDTLTLIAQAFGTTVSKLREMNGLKGDNLRIGQKVKVPLGKE